MSLLHDTSSGVWKPITALYATRRTLEQTDHRRVRMRGRSQLVDTVVRTLGLALRGVHRAPGFTASVVVILALGIGANAVMFGVVDRLLLSPPQHVVNADEVRLLRVMQRSGNTSGRFLREIAFSQRISYPDYQDFLGVDAFTDVAAYPFTTEQTVSVAARLRAARRITDPPSPTRGRGRAVSLAHPRIRSSRPCMAGRRARTLPWGRASQGEGLASLKQGAGLGKGL